MRLLYISSWHGVLEYDELRLFSELGIDWFSTGVYMHPVIPISINAVRPAISKPINKDIEEFFRRSNPHHQVFKKINLDNQILSHFDVVYISSCYPYPRYLQDNWMHISQKPVIWRTFSQQSKQEETFATECRSRKKDFYRVRVSPKEANIPMYGGEEAIIRPYVDFNEYSGWTGESNTVLTFQNHYSQRKRIAGPVYNAYERAVSGYSPVLYGIDSNASAVPWGKGILSWEQQKNAYKKSRVYFSIGSAPATLSYNLIEAMVTGTPTITFNRGLGESSTIKTYEAPDIIQHGVNGFCTDNIDEIHTIITRLQNEPEYAAQISQKSRESVSQMFSKETCKTAWKNLFTTMGFNL